MSMTHPLASSSSRDRLTTASVTGSPAPPATPANPEAISVAAFLDQVAGILRAELPAKVWVEATILSVRASAFGHTLEIADATTTGASPPTLRLFLPTAGLATIRQNLGLAIDPMLLIGLTTALLVAPTFSARWHLGARVEALTQAAGASLRQRLLDQAVADLKREGLWDRQRRLPRPRDITRVSVIHPSGAAGWHDIAGELARWERAGLLAVRSVAVPFEGDRAVANLIAALESAVAPIAGFMPDLILVVRGGGARASLTSLDDAALVRAVCRCPVPIVVGTGHACDATLLDRQAWMSVDTPSKTLSLVAGIVGTAVRGASASWVSIGAAGRRTLTAHDQELELRSAQVRASADRTLAALASDLASRWSQLLVGAHAAKERTHQRDAAAQQLLTDILRRGAAQLDAQQHHLQERLRGGLGRATALLARCDDGRLALGAVLSSARARLAHEIAAIARLRDATLRDACHARDCAEAALAALAATAEAHDLTAILQRGVVIVTDAAGRIVRSRAAAASAARLVLTFADGDLAVTGTGDDADA